MQNHTTACAKDIMHRRLAFDAKHFHVVLDTCRCGGSEKKNQRVFLNRILILMALKRNFSESISFKHRQFATAL